MRSNKTTAVAGSSSGLCNRLRLLSCFQSNVDHVRFLWPKNLACNAYYDELFHPTNKCNVVRATAREARRYQKKCVGDNRQISLLDFSPKFEITKLKEPYVAVHVRRTDIVGILRKYKVSPMNDQAYFDFIDATQIDKIFLATDNKKTQDIFKIKYKERLIVHADIQHYGSNISPFRTTDIPTAIKDLHLCVFSDCFLGSPCSSFSGEIMFARSKMNDTEKATK